MEEKLAMSMVREEKQRLEKEMTIKEIVEEEKRLLAERF